MSELSEQAVRQALTAVKYPGYSRDIVSFGLVQGITIEQDTVRVALQLSTANAEVVRQIRQEAERVLRTLPDVKQVQVDVSQPTAPPGSGAASPWANQNRLAGVRRILAVASGKGGVGKSTVSVNLACALHQQGLQVGLLDCDIYGPSIPLMMGVRERPTLGEDHKMLPLVSHGVKLMSIGFLVDDTQPVIWRGPLIAKAIQQFFEAVAWGQLDVLLVDLPPGTGDAQLSLCQTVPLDGGIIVTTPQEASLGVVRKSIAMFQKVNVPITGLVENMSYFTAPNGERVEIFGHGGGRAEAERQRVPFLGEIPIHTEIREGGDRGLPVVVSLPDSPPGRAFAQLATAVKQLLA